jgi:microcystin-dependent protein
MPDAYTSGKLKLIEPSNGGYVNIWDGPLAANWITLDAAVSGTTTVALSNLNVVLVTPSYPSSTNPAGVTNSTQNLRLLLTGVLTSNVTVSIPSGITGMWLVDNQTTGSAYAVTVNTSAGGSTGVLPPRGYLSYIFSDGTNVRYADGGAISEAISAIQINPPGLIAPFGGTVSPSGWLFCDGAAVSRSTYAALFSAIGVTWGSGDGFNTFNLPDLRNMFLRGSGTSAVGVYEDEDFKSHTHTATITDPGHKHQTALLSGIPSLAYGAGTTINGIAGGSITTAPSSFTETKTTGVTVSNASTGGTETRPVNKRVLYIIKT